MQRILCIWLPGWPLQRQVAARPELRVGPLALYARDPRRGERIVACSSAAYQRGIRPGMPLTEAQAVGEKRGGLRTEERRPKAEGRRTKGDDGDRKVRAARLRQPVMVVEPQNVEQGISNVEVVIEAHSPQPNSGCFCRHDPLADREALTELALWCEQFSPLVGLEPECEPSCLLLDVTGLATLFGGEMALAERVVAQFRQRGYQVRCAIADTVGTAWATARFGRYLDSTTVDTTAGDFPLRLVQPGAGLVPLGPLPLAALRLDDSTRELLHRLGIRCVRQLAALPRAELTSRLGDQVVQRLGQAEGTIKEVIVAVRPPPAFQARWALQHPTHRQTVIREVLDQLIRRVALLLANEDRGAVQLECRLRLLRESSPSPGGLPADQQGRGGRSRDRGDREIVLRVGLFQPTAVAEHLCQLAGMQLERTRLPQLVEEVQVQAVATSRLVARQQPLFSQSSSGDPRQVALLVDRLAGRLGRDRVVGVQLQPESQVERAYGYHSLVGIKKGTGVFSRLPGEHRTQTGTPRKEKTPVPFLRPLRLAVPAPAIEVLAAAPGGPPVRFQIGGQVYQVHRYWGPERIETGWWRGRSVRRDYYRVETTTGQRFWLFRGREDERWYLQGMFE